MRNRKVGKIHISNRVLHTVDYSLLMKIFNGLLVLQTNYNFYNDVTEYTVYGEMFDSLEDGQIVPNYNVHVIYDNKTFLGIIFVKVTNLLNLRTLKITDFK